MEEINIILGDLKITNFKQLVKEDREVILKKIKAINGIAYRQIARLLGISSRYI